MRSRLAVRMGDHRRLRPLERRHRGLSQSVRVELAGAGKFHNPDRDQVGNGFLRSIESIRRVVTSYFGSYLKRTIDSAGAAPFVTQSQAGVTFGRIAANILGSDEFFVAAGQNLN